jgi:hypothetical protein
MAEAAITLARRTLAAALGIPATSIAVELAEPVDWRDAALGCPQKGMAYPQVIVPGFRVLLRAGGRRHRVHVGAGRAVVCGSEPI